MQSRSFAAGNGGANVPQRPEPPLRPAHSTACGTICAGMRRWAHSSHCRRAPSRTSSERPVAAALLCLETIRHLAAGLGELGYDLPVQPEVHLGGAIERAGVAELLCQLLARAETAFQFQQLHQIDDRLSPVEVFSLIVVQPLENGFDVFA